MPQEKITNKGSGICPIISPDYFRARKNLEIK
jgi:hypothetical protein